MNETLTIVLLLKSCLSTTEICYIVDADLLLNCLLNCFNLCLVIIMHFVTNGTSLHSQELNISHRMHNHCTDCS